jgi:hypothetical protein
VKKTIEQKEDCLKEFSILIDGTGPEGAEASFQVGRHRAAFFVGLALHFALSASPNGLRRATLRAKPTGQKNRDP